MNVKAAGRKSHRRPEFVSQRLGIRATSKSDTILLVIDHAVG
jgi:hypothetical protein